MTTDRADAAVTGEPTVGSLFSGYGGLDMAVVDHYGARVVWHVERDKHPAAVLQRHYPNVPNLGDITDVDWGLVEPVDIVTGGYPCQPFSNAGQRRGTTDERHLWPYVADCLRVLRPRIAVFENVTGHLSLGFDTALADLAALGFDAVWGVVSAAEAGAAHRRQRLFIVATDAGRGQLAGAAERSDGLSVAGQRSGTADVTLLPTPAVNDMGAGKTPEQWDDWAPRQQSSDGRPAPHGKSLAIEAQRLLPTPTARDHKDGATNPDCVPVNGLLGRAVWHDFGPYSAAIDRWAAVIGRPAPAPTEPGQNGRPRLSPAFVEWLMGLPDGWVTDSGIPHSAQLKALGNGVVPQQATLALDLLERVP